MKKLVGISLILAMSAAGAVYGADGAALVKSKGCTACHHPTKDQLSMGLGPSFQMISTAYKENGGKDSIVKFLLGQGDPIVAPKKFSIMKSQLNTTKKFSDEERAAIADYILSN